MLHSCSSLLAEHIDNFRLLTFVRMNVAFYIIIAIVIASNNVQSAYVESIDEPKMSPSEGSSSNNYIYRRGMSLRNGHIGASLNMPHYRLCYLRGPIAALFKSGFQWLQKSQDPTGREGSFYPACHPRFMVKDEVVA